MESLDSILAKYDLRKTTEAEARRVKLEGEAGFREKAVDLFRSVLLPRLDEIAEALEEHGHDVEIRERLEGFEFPGVELLLSAKQIDIEPLTPSSLIFTAMAPSKLEIQRFVIAQNPAKSFNSTKSCHLDSVSRGQSGGWAVEFVHQVLELS